MPPLCVPQYGMCNHTHDLTPPSPAQFHAILGIPDYIESAAIIPLGWPDRAYGPNRRLPLERFVMRDRWNG